MTRSLFRAGTGMLVLAVCLALWVAPTAAQQGECPTIFGPASKYALTLQDFGRERGAQVVSIDETYYGSLGYYFSFDRAEPEGYLESPRGGYLVGGVVVWGEEERARADVLRVVADWTREWSQFDTPPASGVGDEIKVVTRTTPWQIDEGKPMAEVFVSFRRCNATAHFLFAIMPERDPVGQALRYARIIDQRFQQ